MDALSAAGFLLGLEMFFDSHRGWPPWVTRGEFQFHAWTARICVYEATEVDRCRVEAMRNFVADLVGRMSKERARRLKRRDRVRDAVAGQARLAEESDSS